MNINVATDPIAKTESGEDVYLKDIWPTKDEISKMVREYVSPQMFSERYAEVFEGDARWQAIESGSGDTYNWPSSTYVANPPYFQDMGARPGEPEPIEKARIIALLEDSVTTDHISPAGAIKKDSPAGEYLQSHQVPEREFNSYGSRRGNHEVMMRGTFANIRIKNQMLDGVEGGYTKYVPTGTQMPIYDAAMKYKAEGTPLVVFAGEQYGTGSSRDWAAKGTILLGIRAVVAASFERIHRSNLIGMGVLPLQFQEGQSWKSLGLDGTEEVSIHGIEGLKPQQDVKATITKADGSTTDITFLARIDTADELDYFRNGGILQYVIRKLAA
jgi:aconitate hydratase